MYKNNSFKTGLKKTTNFFTWKKRLRGKKKNKVGKMNKIQTQLDSIFLQQIQSNVWHVELSIFASLR